MEKGSELVTEVAPDKSTAYPPKQRVRYPTESHRLLTGSLGGVGVLFLTIIITTNPSDPLLNAAVYALCASVPILALSLMWAFDQRAKVGPALCLLLGGLGVTAGVGAAIWHFNWIAGAIFLGTSTLSLFIGLTVLARATA